MPAVVRVKRRIDEEPLSAFVLNGKKRRLENGMADACTETVQVLNETGGKEEISTILKFAGTVSKQDDTSITQYARLTKDEAKQLVALKTRKPPANCTERARQEMRQSLHDNRFRVVNCLRTTLETDEPTVSAMAKEITIVDIEKQSVLTNSVTGTNNSNTAGDATNSTATSFAAQLNGLSQPTDSDTGYVYDLYLPENEQQANNVDLMDDNYLRVRPFDNLVYEDHFNNDDEDDCDSEDSNEENYFTNDYPDEDEFFESDCGHDDYESEDCYEMRQGVKKFMLDDDDDDDDDDNDVDGFGQSSEDEDFNQFEDPYVHSVDVIGDNFVDNVDYLNVAAAYGNSYDRYKKRILQDMKEKSEEIDNDKKEANDNGDKKEDSVI